MGSFDTSKFYLAKLASTRKGDISLLSSWLAPCSEHLSTLFTWNYPNSFQYHFTPESLGIFHSPRTRGAFSKFLLQWLEPRLLR